VREILEAIGENPDREGLRETPARVARAYREIFSGMNQDAGKPLAKVFDHADGGLVMVKDIEFYSVCEHHLLPFFGKAHIAYLPGRGKVVGLSKLARTVEILARRPQIQERLSAQIADSIEEHLGAEGVAVVIEAEHLCMKMRGARSTRATMATVACRGAFEHDRQLRTEVLQSLGLNGAGIMSFATSRSSSSGVTH